jgi:hypothetical protein
MVLILGFLTHILSWGKADRTPDPSAAPPPSGRSPACESGIDLFPRVQVERTVKGTSTCGTTLVRPMQKLAANSRLKLGADPRVGSWVTCSKTES